MDGDDDVLFCGGALPWRGIAPPDSSDKFSTRFAVRSDRLFAGSPLLDRERTRIPTWDAISSVCVRKKLSIVGCIFKTWVTLLVAVAI